MVPGKRTSMPLNRKKKPVSQDKIRTRIFRTAEILFSEKGYFNTTVRDITAKAGVNVASINYYFRTKENCYLFFGTEGSLAFPSMERIAYASASRAGWQHPLVGEGVPVAAAGADPLARQLKHFCAVIRGRERPRTDGDDALRTLAATRAVLASGASGEAVDLAGN